VGAAAGQESRASPPRARGELHSTAPSPPFPSLLDSSASPTQSKAQAQTPHPCPVPRSGRRSWRLEGKPQPQYFVPFRHPALRWHQAGLQGATRGFRLGPA